MCEQQDTPCELLAPWTTLQREGEKKLSQERSCWNKLIWSIYDHFPASLHILYLVKLLWETLLNVQKSDGIEKVNIVFIAFYGTSNKFSGYSYTFFNKEGCLENILSTMQYDSTSLILLTISCFALLCFLINLKQSFTHSERENTA